jgi:hypothetical protein
VEEKGSREKKRGKERKGEERKDKEEQGIKGKIGKRREEREVVEAPITHTHTRTTSFLLLPSVFALDVVVCANTRTLSPPSPPFPLS